MISLPPGYQAVGKPMLTLGGTLRRVQRTSDRQEYFARSCAVEFPAEQELHRFAAELAGNLLPPCPAVWAPLERIDTERNCWLLYEARDGQPLSLDRSYTREEAWQLALALVTCISDCHASGRIHGALDPSCVWLDPRRQRAAIIGALPRTTAGRVPAPRWNEFTAPELIGAKDGELTEAADIYAVGVMLHRLFAPRAGSPPGGDTMLELVGQPLPALDPQHFEQGLPELVQTLLAKSPALRAKSAGRVLLELQAIRSGVPHYKPEANFKLREGVAREAELEQLLEAASHRPGGQAKLVLIEGEPGVGKSFLLQQLKRQPVIRAGAVAEAKYDQFRRERPYSALLDALRSVLEHALADADTGFARLKDRLATGNRQMLGVLRSEIPELELVSGWLPVPPKLGATETQNRFKQAFRTVLELMCDPNAPLLLILDDMQWADSATCDLLNELITTSLPRFLTLVLAYRPDEAESNQRLAPLLAAQEPAAHIRLAPLTYEQTTALCAAVFPHCANNAQLALNVHTVCRGNPLHSMEVLKRLLRSGAMMPTEQGWWFDSTINPTGSSPAAPSETVVNLITSRIVAAPEPVQDLLKAAACAGQRFSVQLLGVAFGDNTKVATQLMRNAVDEGLLALVPQSDGEYCFAHDRVQQAAFTLGNTAFHREVHLRLGRHFRAAAKESNQCLFSCVEHLSQARSLLAPAETEELAALIFLAAKKALESIAYQRATRLLEAFLAESRASGAELIDAKLMLAECYYLSLAYDAAEEALSECQAAATSTEQQVRVLRIRLSLYQHSQRYEDAVNVALQALAILGHPLPKRPTPPRLIAGIANLMAKTRSVDAHVLASRADEATPEQSEILDFLSLLWGPSFWVNKGLNGLVVIHLMKLTLRHGNSKNAPFAYVCFAVLNHVLLKRHRAALEYARLALSLAEDTTPFIRLRVQFLALTFFGAFERSATENVALYEQALQECLTVGEHVASHLLDGIITTLPALEVGVSAISGSLARYRVTAQSVGADSTLELIDVVSRWCLTLQDGPDTAQSTLDTPVTYASYTGVRDLLRMQTAYLWDDDEQALALANQIAGDVVIQSNPLHSCMYALFHVLALLRAKRRLNRAATKSLRTLERLAGIKPANFGPAHLLAKAELQATAGNAGLAGELFHQALVACNKHGHPLLAALCAERFAVYCELQHEPLQHGEYMRVAGFAYSRFGARAKLEQLKVKYPGINWRANAETSPTSGGLQIEAVMKAASAIAEETSGEQLGPTLLRVIATAAGAQRALLLMHHKDGWVLQAGWDPDRGSIISQPRALADVGHQLPIAVVRYVARTRKVVQLPDDHERIIEDPYLAKYSPRTLLCVPLLHRGVLNSILYLENSLYADVFTPEQRQLVTLLGNHAAIALSNLDHHRLQMEAIQAKVNPHFLYNALSVIAELVATDPERAEQAVFGLARLYRYILNSSVEDKVPLERELAIVRDYLELEKARFGPRLQVEWDVDEELTAASVPALLLQPLAENAVNHGIRRNLEGGTVRLKVEGEGNHLVLVVADNGPGWYEGQGGSGFGVRSVEQRLQLVYGDRASLSFDRGDGVTATIRLPF